MNPNLLEPHTNFDLFLWSCLHEPLLLLFPKNNPPHPTSPPQRFMAVGCHPRSRYIPLFWLRYFAKRARNVPRLDGTTAPCWFMVPYGPLRARSHLLRTTPCRSHPARAILFFHHTSFNSMVFRDWLYGSIWAPHGWIDIFFHVSSIVILIHLVWFYVFSLIVLIF